jgi:nucleotide-binding universal stress UspA family protein
MKIVVGYLPSPEGMAALEYAITQASRDGAHLVVVNSGRQDDYAHPDFASAKDLDALADQLEEAGLSHEVRQPTSGRTPAEEILSTAQEVDAALIVIGLRRRSVVGKLVTGSTAQQVLLEADCPVAAVKPR